MGSSLEDKLNNSFWNWFKGSKITDGGNPVVCYHGSKNLDLKSFDLSFTGSNTDSGMFGKGFYFTLDRSVASTYGGKVLSVFLSIKNPLIINTKEDIPEILTPDETLDDMFNSPEKYSEMFREYLIENNFDGVIDNLSVKNQYVALYPDQIKSTENDGSWDVNDENIFS